MTSPLPLTPVPPFLDSWLQPARPASGSPSPANVSVFEEVAGARATVATALRQAVLDHHCDLKIIERMGGFAKSLAVIKNRLPKDKRMRSGDLGEIIATEFIAQKTPYIVPIKRLRYKDDRDMSMRGDDVIAISPPAAPLRVLKAESKSRKKIAQSIVSEASAALVKNGGRPSPSTLSFISFVLRRENQDELAARVEELQTKVFPDSALEHLIFTLSGNDPVSALYPHAISPLSSIGRRLVGVMVQDHQDFVELLYNSL